VGGRGGRPEPALKARFPDAEAWQLSTTGRKDFLSAEGIRAAPTLKLLRRLI
jgi:hypothetical protein